MAQCFWMRLIGTFFSYEKLNFSCTARPERDRGGREKGGRKEGKRAQAEPTMNTRSTREQFSFFSINIGYLDKSVISVAIYTVESPGGFILLI